MAYGQALMQQGASTAPVRSPLEGFARALTAGVGGFTQSKARDRYTADDEKYRKGLTTALQGGDVLAALQSSEDPSLQQLALDARLKQALDTKPDDLVKIYDPTTQTERYVKKSQAEGMQASGPEKIKVGTTRTYRVGNQEVTDQWDGNQWANLGQGAAFAPSQQPQNEYGLNVFYTQDQDGKVHAWQLSKSGERKEVSIDGQTPAPQAQFLDLGTAQQPVDRRTGQAIPGAQPMPIDVAGEAQNKSLGSNTGEAQFALPTAVNNAQMALDEIQAIRDDPSRKTGTGMSSILNSIPGTGAYDFQKRVDQARSGAFLQAFNSLRGGGAISDAEGRKAEEALARLSTSQTEEGFTKALDDFESVVRKGLAVAQQKAGAPQTPIVPSQPQGGPQPGTVEGGYRFKGGDPADQNNWEKVN
jgi:hypothetical protein